MEILVLFWSFFKIGIFGFVGGPAMVPLLQREVVEGRGWMDMEEFAKSIAVVNAVPGPFSPKMAFLVGYKRAGVAGAFSGLIGIIAPSTILFLLLFPLQSHFKDAKFVQSALKSAKPVAISFLLFASYELFKPSIKGWDTALIAIVAFALLLLNIHPAIIIVGSLILGIIVY